MESAPNRQPCSPRWKQKKR